MHKVDTSTVYAVIKQDVIDNIEVYIDSSFPAVRDFSGQTKTNRPAVGWAMKGSDGELSGYGGSFFTAPRSNSGAANELGGVTKFFDIMKGYLPDAYTQDSVFIVYNDNWGLVQTFSRIIRGEVSLDEVALTFPDFTQKEYDLTHQMLTEFNVEFRWVKGHRNSPFNRLGDQLAKKFYNNHRKYGKFNGTRREDAIQKYLQDFEVAMVQEEERREKVTASPSPIFDVYDVASTDFPPSRYDEAISAFQENLGMHPLQTAEDIRIIDNKGRYAALRSDISESVDVYLGYYFDLSADNLPTDMTLGIGWGLLDKNGEMAGYGVSGMRPKNLFNDSVAELHGILHFLSVMEIHFSRQYDTNTKFVIHTHNEKVVEFLQDCIAGGIDSAEDNLKRLFNWQVFQKSIEQLTRLNVEIRYLPIESGNILSRFATNLAYACYSTRRKNIKFIDHVRADQLRVCLDGLKQDSALVASQVVNAS